MCAATTLQSQVSVSWARGQELGVGGLSFVGSCIGIVSATRRNADTRRARKGEAINFESNNNERCVGEG